MLTRNAILSLIEPLLRPIRQRIMMTVARGILETITDSKGIQLAKVSLLKDETLEGLERVQNYGFTSNPPAGSELVAVFVGGNRELGFVIACDSREKRIKNLAPGECALYTDQINHRIALKTGGKVEIRNSSVDLINAFSQTLAALAAEPFIVNKATFTALKILVDTMKV